MEFKVKRSFLGIFIINLCIAFLFGVSLPFAYNTFVFIVVFSIVLALAIFYNTAVIFASCKVEQDKLTYRTGAFKYEIDLKTVTKVQKSNNYHPSLALSPERIRILTGKGKEQKVYYISVIDREKLISILREYTQTAEETVAKKTKEEKTEKKTPKKTTAKKPTTKK